MILINFRFENQNKYKLKIKHKLLKGTSTIKIKKVLANTLSNFFDQL